MEEVPTNNNTDAKVVACLLGDSNNKVARYPRALKKNEGICVLVRTFTILL